MSNSHDHVSITNCENHSVLSRESPLVDLPILTRELLEFSVMRFAQISSASVTDVNSSVSNLLSRDRADCLGTTTYDRALLSLGHLSHRNRPYMNGGA